MKRLFERKLVWWFVALTLLLGWCGRDGQRAFASGIATITSVFNGSTSGTATGTAGAPVFSFANVGSKSPIIFDFTMSAAVTNPTFTNTTAGARLLIRITSDGNSAHTWTWNGNVADGACSVYTDAAAKTVAHLYVDADGVTVRGEGCDLPSISNAVAVGASAAASGTTPTVAGNIDCRLTAAGFDCLDSSAVHHLTIVGAASATTGKGVQYINASGAQVYVERWGTCTIDNDTQSATALIAANFSGGCEIPAAATITEVDVWGGTGVVGSPATSGTSSINLQKFSPNGGGTTTLLSGALATASGYACALTATSGTCANGTTSSNSITISTTALSAGDWVRVSAATPDTTQTWYRAAIVYTFN